jgi:hypothetical protein
MSFIMGCRPPAPSWRDTQSDEQTLLELRDWSPYGKDALIGISLVPEEWKQS